MEGTMKKQDKREHPNWGGPRENSGGPRQPGPGKTMGRPKKFGDALIRKDVRIPPAWEAAIVAYGNGDFAEGVRKIILESGIVTQV